MSKDLGVQSHRPRKARGFPAVKIYRHLTTTKRTFIMESTIVASMETKRLLSGKNSQLTAKEIAIFEDPTELKAALHKLSWKILQLLSEKEMYPMEIARKLKLHEQRIYYHIRKLTKVGAIKVVREEEKKGALKRVRVLSRSSVPRCPSQRRDIRRRSG